MFLSVVFGINFICDLFLGSWEEFLDSKSCPLLFTKLSNIFPFGFWDLVQKSYETQIFDTSSLICT